MLLGLQARGDLGVGLLHQRAARGITLIDGPAQGGVVAQFDRQLTGLAGLERSLHRLGQEALVAGLEVELLGIRVQGPGLDLVDPAIDPIRADHSAVEVGAARNRAGSKPRPQGVAALAPTLLQSPQLFGLAPGQVADGFGAAGHAHITHLQQRHQRVLQRVHVRPLRQHGGQRLALQRVDLAAPPVAQRLAAQLGLVGHELLVEAAATVEGVFAQHALAPGVDGVHGRLVHGVGGAQQQPQGGLALGGGGAGGDERLQHGIGIVPGARALAEGRGGLRQPLADALHQLARGGLREAHHEDLARVQRPRTAIAEHQAQHQGGQRPGLAGAGAGLDDVAAGQGQRQQVEPISHRRPRRHRRPPPRRAAGRSAACPATRRTGRTAWR